MQDFTFVQTVSGTVFFLMTLFYVVRLFSSAQVISCCGYFSPVQEGAHMLCALGMLAMSLPFPSFIPSGVWVGIFSGLTALSLGILLSSEKGKKPSRLWLGMHVGIYAGMAYMFFGSIHPALTWTFSVFYGAVVFFFLRELRDSVTIRPFTPLSVGADAFHVLMAVGMILMFLWPQVYMSKIHKEGPVDHSHMHHH